MLVDVNVNNFYHRLNTLPKKGRDNNNATNASLKSYSTSLIVPCRSIAVMVDIPTKINVYICTASMLSSKVRV